MENITQAKILLGIEDNLQDKLLTTIATLTTANFLAYAGVDDVPEGLEYIITEVIVKRFNRIGAEGMSSQSLEGASMRFDFDDFKEYDSVIKRVCSKTFNAGFKMLLDITIEWRFSLKNKKSIILKQANIHLVKMKC